MTNQSFNIKLEKMAITGNTEIAPDVFLLKITKKRNFLPGQVIGIHLSPDDQVHSPRLYSIASNPDDNEYQILFNIKPDGWLTPQLARLQTGDTVYVTEPFGNFTCTDEPAWWIASGTGIAPFASMFFAGLGKNKTLIHGGRILSSFYFEHNFQAGLKQHYIRCCSQEKGKGVYGGRLTKYLNEQESIPSGQKYYLCGSPQMVVEVRDILIRKKVPFHNILAEIYF